MIKKYFILKDFIDFPIGVVSGDYIYGILVSGDFRCPRKLTKKFPGFDSLEEMQSYKMCSCGKESCTHNNELRRLVNELMNLECMSKN